jgi:ankyrin repeat protein
MNAELVFIYACLIAFAVFVTWQIRNNPIGQIHNAVSDGDLERVREYLNKSVDPNLLKFGWQSPLCLAANKGHKEIAELLIAHGADINRGLEDENGTNALLEAAINKHQDLVESLIAQGAKFGIHFAALQGNIESVRLFMQNENFQINSERCSINPFHSMTALALASMGGHQNVVELLLDSGANIEGNNASSSLRITPLYKAVTYNQSKTVELLIDRGASINLSRALYQATYQNNLEIVRLLISKGGDVNYQDSTTDPPLYIAAEKGYIEITKLLVSHNANVNAIGYFTKKSPLHLAAEHGHLTIATILIANGADVNKNSGSIVPVTPLDYAENSGYTKLITLLKRHGGVGYGFLD